jgi:hypothetical protein
MNNIPELEHALKIQEYHNMLDKMDTEFLCYEFEDKIGNEDGRFEHLLEYKGRETVIQTLLERFEYNLNKPYLQ